MEHNVIGKIIVEIKHVMIIKNNNVNKQIVNYVFIKMNNVNQ